MGCDDMLYFSHGMDVCGRRWHGDGNSILLVPKFATAHVHFGVNHLLFPMNMFKLIALEYRKVKLGPS